MAVMLLRLKAFKICLAMERSRLMTESRSGKAWACPA
jgi:hypothetical protein